METASEQFRTLRGMLAYLVCMYTPLDRFWWRGYLWLLPYAGDWAYREERLAISPSPSKGK